jgi:hypothetical protein
MIRRLPLFALSALALQCSSGGSGTSIAGTWDFTAAEPGQTAATGTVVLSSSELTVTSGSSSLSYTANGNALAVALTTTGAPTTQVAVVNTPGSFNTGAIPLSLGGNWTFSDPTASSPGNCTVSVGEGAGTATCQGHFGGHGGLEFDFTSGGGTVVGNFTRQSTGTSIFGDLSGTWSASGGGSGSCTVTFAGSTFSTTCSNMGQLDGTLSLTFNGDSASGTTSGGVELSAHQQ